MKRNTESGVHNAEAISFPLVIKYDNKVPVYETHGELVLFLSFYILVS